MNNIKTIICLASSRKWSGRCVVGKELQNKQWIRPVSERPTGEILLKPKPLEILSIPIVEYKPHDYQQENYLVLEENWKKKGKIAWRELSGLTDKVTGDLWTNGYSSYNGVNDRIPQDEANKLKNSVLLLQPDNFTITINSEWAGKKKIRAVFSVNHTTYKLIITDPKIENFFINNYSGEYHFNAKQLYLCLSLGEPFQGYCYKLVASVLFKHWWLPYLASVRGLFTRLKNNPL